MSADLLHRPAQAVAASPAPATIRALTGLRAVAAVWVVLFHYRGDVLTLLPAARPLEPLMASGYLGVDVFFVLSGFVLAYNYANRLGTWRPPPRPAPSCRTGWPGCGRCTW